jgi:hypothetical protein
VSNVVTINGTLIVGPPSASDSAFPSGVTNILFGTNPPQKPAPVQTSNVRQVNSPAAFVPLDGVGVGETLTQGNTFYARMQSPMQLRFTFQVTPVDVVSVVYPKGLLIMEIDEQHPIKLVEVMGVGTIEYFVSGNQ